MRLLVSICTEDKYIFFIGGLIDEITSHYAPPATRLIPATAQMPLVAAENE